jgi:hypothetical protein
VGRGGGGDVITMSNHDSKLKKDRKYPQSMKLLQVPLIMSLDF